ncbi:hypothetical protein OAO18_09285, partial [Francisellaceae bacterium]|nr:hypothetical protein [Francisellaceae bacterium]
GFYNQDIRLCYIDIISQEKLNIPVNNIFTFNLLPIFSIIKEYSKKININGSKEYYPIIPSNNAKNASLLGEETVQIGANTIKRLQVSDNENTSNFSYLIKTLRANKHAIKINGPLVNIIDKPIQLFGEWTQLIDINSYQNETVRIIDRSKSTYVPKVVYKGNFVLNDNIHKVNRFIELSHFLSNKILSKKTIHSLLQIISPSNNIDYMIEDLISVIFEQSDSIIYLKFKFQNKERELEILYHIERLKKLLNYLYYRSVLLECSFEI